jgi:hypothetical protein
MSVRGTARDVDLAHEHGMALGQVGHDAARLRVIEAAGVAKGAARQRGVLHAAVPVGGHDTEVTTDGRGHAHRTGVSTIAPGAIGSLELSDLAGVGDQRVAGDMRVAFVVMDGVLLGRALGRRRSSRRASAVVVAYHTHSDLMSMKEDDHECDRYIFCIM